MRGKMIQDSKPVLRTRLAVAYEAIDTLRAELATATESAPRLCWWSSLAGSGLTLAGLWLAGAL